MEIARCSNVRHPQLTGAGKFDFRHFLLVWSIFAATAISSWASTSTVCGQEVFDPASVSTDDGSGDSWNLDHWVVEVLILTVGVIITTTVVFSMVYPFLLGRWFWPLNAYGISLAVIVTCSCVIAALLFWEDLLEKIPAPIRWVQKYGGLMVLALGWLFAIALIALVCRSDRGRVATR